VQRCHTAITEVSRHLVPYYQKQENNTSSPQVVNTPGTSSFITKDSRINILVIIMHYRTLQNNS
jgi:hypothetical protein